MVEVYSFSLVKFYPSHSLINQMIPTSLSMWNDLNNFVPDAAMVQIQYCAELVDPDVIHLNPLAVNHFIYIRLHLIETVQQYMVFTVLALCLPI